MRALRLTAGKLIAGRLTAAVVALSVASFGIGCGGGGATSSTSLATGSGVNFGGPGNVNINPGNGTTTGTGSGTTVAATADAYTTDALNGSVEVYDLQSGQVSASLPVPGASGIGYDAASQRMLVTSFSQTLTEIDTQTSPPTIAQTHRLDQGSHTQNTLLSFLDPIVGIAVRPMGVLALNGSKFVPSLITTKVVDPSGQQYGVMDIVTQPIFSFIPGLTIPTNLRGIGAFDAAMSGGKIFVCNAFSDTVTVIDPALINSAQDPVVASIPIGMSGGMAFPVAITADDAGRVYVACALSGEVVIIDTLSGNQQTYLPFVGAGPVAMTFDPGTSQVYIANFFDGTVVAIDTSLGLVVNTYQVSGIGSLFAAMGLSSNAFMQALQGAFGGLGAPQGGSSPSTAVGALMGLLGGLGGGTGSAGGTGQGNFISALFSGLFGAAFPGAGNGSSPFGGLPVPGLTGVSVTRSGKVVATSGLFGGCDVLDPNTNGVTSIPAANGLAAGGMFPGWARVAIHNR